MDRMYQNDTVTVTGRDWAIKVFQPEWTVESSVTSLPNVTMSGYYEVVNPYKVKVEDMIRKSVDVKRGRVQWMEFEDCGWCDVERVIFNAPATIVKWKDGSKSVVKCTECKFCGENMRKRCQNDRDWREVGLLHALLRKAVGNSYLDVMKEWV